MRSRIAFTFPTSLKIKSGNYGERAHFVVLPSPISSLFFVPSLRQQK